MNEILSVQKSNLTIKGYPLYSANDVSFWPRSEWLVDGIIQRRSSAVIFGESRIGKSFLALDLASKLASGDSWFGYPVKKCNVIYFPAESPLGLHQRLEAMRVHTGHQFPENLQFMRSSVDVSNSDDVTKVIATVSNSADVLFIDTFNAVASSSDENSSKEMGRVLNGVRRIIDETGCTVIFVHHCGWNEKDRMRGHSSFSAAMDTRIGVTRDSGHPAWRVRGQREGADTESHRYELRVIDLPDLKCSSCVVLPIDGSPARKVIPQPRTENQKTCLSVARELLSISQSQVKVDNLIDESTKLMNADIKHRRQRSKESVDALVKAGFINVDDKGYITLPN